jgi:hypothetical protein
LSHLLAITEVVLKSVLAMIDSFGISAGGVVMIGIWAMTGCQGLSLGWYNMVPGKPCCWVKRDESYGN